MSGSGARAAVTRSPRVAGSAAPDRATPANVPPLLARAAGWSWRLLLIGVVAYLAVRALAVVSLVVLPIVAAILLAALLRPVAELLRRCLPGPAAALVTLLAALAVLGGAGYAIGVRFAQQTPELVGELVATTDRIGQTLSGLGISSLSVGALQSMITGWLRGNQGRLIGYLGTGAGYLLEAGTFLVLTVFVTFFLLYDGRRIWGWMLQPLQPQARASVDRAGGAAWETLTRYIHGTAVIATIHGVVIGTVLLLLGAPLVIPLAALVFLGGFIPIIGALVAGGVAVLVTFGAQGWVAGLILLAVLIIEDQLEAHVLQPLIMGRYVRLHPLAIGLALAVGTVLAGLVGAILAVPTAAVVHAALPHLSRPPIPPRATPGHLGGPTGGVADQA